MIARLARRRRPAAAPTPTVADLSPAWDPRDNCAVLRCRNAWTHPHHGYGLCDTHEAARNADPATTAARAFVRPVRAWS